MKVEDTTAGVGWGVVDSEYHGISRREVGEKNNNGGYRVSGVCWSYQKIFHLIPCSQGSDL